MTGPLVSVIVPVFNTDARWLRACIESVKRQAYPRWQLWLADDGSGTPEINRSARIGITRNAEKPWRFFIRGNRWVSGPAKLNNGQ